MTIARTDFLRIVAAGGAGLTLGIELRPRAAVGGSRARFFAGGVAENASRRHGDRDGQQRRARSRHHDDVLDARRRRTRSAARPDALRVGAGRSALLRSEHARDGDRRQPQHEEHGPDDAPSRSDGARDARGRRRAKVERRSGEVHDGERRRHRPGRSNRERTPICWILRRRCPCPRRSRSKRRIASA